MKGAPNKVSITIDTKGNNMNNYVKRGMIAVALTMGMGMTTLSMAEETTGEKAKDAMNDAGRSVKKSVNRAKEKMCAKGDAKCASDKAKNRTGEAKDAASDKVDEVKNKVD